MIKTDSEIEKMANKFMFSGKTTGGGSAGWIKAAYIQGVKDIQNLFTQQDKAAHTVTAWVDEKPLFDKECVFVTADEFHGYWEYKVWQIKELLNDGMVTYLAWLDGDGEEYGDIEDIRADKYMILQSAEQVQLPVNGVNGYSLEEVEKAFDAGFNRGTYEACDIDELVIPKTKKQYIQSLKQR